MKPVMIACYFSAKREADGAYDRLARVLEYTAGIHCRSWSVRIEQINPSLIAPCTGNPSHSWNSAKLDYWANAIDALPIGTEALLIDADTMILKPLAPLWDRPFDVAYTVRERSRLPLNGGVVAVRVSDATKAAIRKWQKINAEMLVNGKLHAPWHRKYAGINQASFGCLLEENGFDGLNVLALPCSEWNCCEWELFGPVTRIVHMKSRLRRATFASRPTECQDLAVLIDKWKRLESEARAALVKASA